jgi:quercetin dioxygenase-like cupin family protein
MADTWEWPDDLDALVAAPDHHTLLLENDEIRVLDTLIGPGETVPVHTHRWPSVLYVLESADLVRRDGEGALLTDSRAEDGPPPVGACVWAPAMPPHTVENVGDSPIHIVNVELKRS